jgi:hypothetical protein
MSLTVTTVGDNVQQPSITAVQYIPDQLIAGEFKIVTSNITVLSGQGILKRGTVVGAVTASGKYIVSIKTATDGSQVPIAILADDVDATSADAIGGAYQTGEFNVNALIYDTGWTALTLGAALRPYSIFVKSAVIAADPS